MAQSRFVSLTSYCVVEYQFEPLGSTNFYTDDFVLIENTLTDSHQIFNDDASYNSTKNIKDLSVVPIGNNTFAYLDSEKLPDYLSYNTDLVSTNLTGYNVVMDKVRFHFVAGFDFDTFVSLILTVANTENDGKNNLFASILLAPETIAELIIFNPRPLFLSNSLYDRYIDILVPSIKNINEDYNTALVPSATFAAAITPTVTGSSGFITNNPISIGLAECGKKKIIYSNSSTSYDSYEVSEFYSATVSQSNEFDNVGAYIGEAANGDFIEFYLTWNGGFPEELISILNRRNPADDWIIIHQLSVFEQIGSAFIDSTRLVFFQEGSFDEPNVFRPVLKNANIAVSMVIDYVVRLTNRRNGDQVIREASYALVSPKKYGPKLNTIQLMDKPQSQKIYNKIVKKNFEATPLFIEPPVIQPGTPPTGVTNPNTQPGTPLTEVIRTEFIPIFFTNNNISVSNESSFVKSKDASEEIVFGPGKMRFILSPFDNIVKLKVHTANTAASDNTLVPLDLNVNNPKYRLVFETNSGKVSIDNVNDSAQENLSTGQVTFNISKKDSEAITQSTNRTVYLISVAQDSRETLMYTSEWRKPNEQADVDAAIAQAKRDAAGSRDIRGLLNGIQSRLDKINSATIRNATQGTNQIKGVGVTPIVNRFGTSNAKSLTPTNRTTNKK
jgi:hypothetical protein